MLLIQILKSSPSFIRFFTCSIFRNLEGRHPSGQNEEEVRLTDPDQIDAKLPPNKKDSGVYLPTDGSRGGSQDFI